MELKKRVLLCLVIAAMFILTLSVYATDDGNSVGARTTSTPVYSVVLPTTGIDFSIDPYGLSAYAGTGKTLEEVLSNPPGLVTSAAATIENKSTVGVMVDTEVYLDSQADIRLAVTKEEARKGLADLYMEILPVGISKGWASTPVTVISDGTAQEGNRFSFSLEKAGDPNSAYSFVVDGYANPYSAIWKNMTSVQPQETINLYMKFTFEYEEEEEETSQDETEETSTEEVSTEETSTGSETDTDETNNGETTTSSGSGNVDFKDGSFELLIKKTEVSSKPTAIHLVYFSQSYNLAMYALVEITEEGDYYKISVQYFDATGMSGTCPLVVYSGNTVIYDKATITIPE